jgi:hypothetical protein
LRQRRWRELIKDYNLSIHHHPRKANVVADTLSRKHYCNNLMVHEGQPALYEELERMSLEIVEEGQLNELRLKYALEDQIDPTGSKRVSGDSRSKKHDGERQSSRLPPR